MLIALTGNLGEVEWNYTVELEDGPVQRSGRMTEAECSEYVGAPVKSFADSPEGVQALLDLLEISGRVCFRHPTNIDQMMRNPCHFFLRHFGGTDI